MVFVAIAALNFGAIRAWSQLRLIHGIGPAGHSITLINNTVDILVLGGLPMANVLVIGQLLGLRRQGSRPRPFLWGFEALGVVALVLFIAWASFFTESSVMPRLYPVLTPFDRMVRANWPGAPAPILNNVVTAVLLGLPQLTLALVGGLVFGMFGRSGRAHRTRE
jgi:hypothetical protein